MKKFLCIISIILIMSTVVTAAIPFSEREGKDVHEIFRDVNKGEWYNKYLVQLVDDGSIDGVIENKQRYFKPNDQLTTAEYITALLKPVIGVQPFETGQPWYYNYAKIAEDKGLIDDKNSSTIDNDITREEMASIAVAFLKDQNNYSPVSTEKYITSINDYQSIDSEHRQSVLYCYGTGILTGYSNSTFRPQNVLTRAEATSVIARIFYEDLRQPVEIDSTNEVQVVEGITVTKDDYIENEAGTILGMETVGEFAKVLYDNLYFYLNDDGYICVKGYVPELPENAEWSGSIKVFNKETGGTSIKILSDSSNNKSKSNQLAFYEGENFDIESTVIFEDMLYIFADFSVTNKNDINAGIVRMSYYSEYFITSTELEGIKNECYYQDYYNGNIDVAILLDWQRMIIWEE
ncbi:S-layer homology domain-containing protein [Vallitalea okinawensis]|uniref:S-layer homology domain-containing protein n=1 Tax=Vallitalea okinawensis TaxID=2078660 RepID=UPI000CFAA874|nr:S-layer homology domain-containing protein [Vallitalea okinawensis]